MTTRLTHIKPGLTTRRAASREPARM